MSKIDKHFISEIDKKMAEFDATHANSSAQQAEFNKYQKIFHLRDVPTTQPVEKETLWE